MFNIYSYSFFFFCPITDSFKENLLFSCTESIFIMDVSCISYFYSADSGAWVETSFHLQASITDHTLYVVMISLLPHKSENN